MNKALRIVFIALLSLIPIALITTMGSHTNNNDFIEYWSAGKLFVHGDNPYSPSLILAIEKSRGFTPNDPLIMLNPPWALPMVFPLGFLPAIPALVLWILACAASLVLSMMLLEVPEQSRMIAFLFAPILGTFMMQQSSPFLLLGLALFLRFHQSRPFAAGAALILMAFKPHLFLIFWVVLLADCLYRRQWKLMLGFVSSLITMSALVTLWMPHVWQGYFNMVRGTTLEQNFYPTLPTLLRAVINVHMVWIATVPSCLAIVWGAVFYWRKRASWDWNRDAMPVLLITVLTSPYSWIADQVVLLPPVARALSPQNGTKPRKFSMEILVAINFIALAWLNLSFRTLVWFPLALSLWYWYAQSGSVNKDSQLLPREPRETPQVIS
jgi:Glycosyltransferase family 87